MKVSFIAVIIFFSAAIVLLGAHDLHRRLAKQKPKGTASQLVRDLRQQNEPVVTGKIMAEPDRTFLSRGREERIEVKSDSQVRPSRLETLVNSLTGRFTGSSTDGKDN